VSVLAAYFPPVEPRCEEHMDATCWQCEGAGRLPCGRHEAGGYAEPDCECCDARDCDVCEGKGWGRWCFHPDCEDCRTADSYWRAYSHREDAMRDSRFNHNP
jgi:hypothetical protein